LAASPTLAKVRAAGTSWRSADLVRLPAWYGDFGHHPAPRARTPTV